MSEPKRLSRQERALQWRRDHVLDCAERIFGRKGFYDATMQEIAREAEYATGTLYTLFDNKEDLFSAVVKRRIPEIESHLRRQVERGTSPPERIENLVRGFFGYFEAQKHLFQIYVNVTGGFLWTVKAELGEQALRSHLFFLTFLQTVFEEGIRSGQFRRDLDPRVMAVGLIGILTGVATDWITRTPDQPFHALLAPTLELVGALLAPGTQPTRERKRRQSRKD